MEASVGYRYLLGTPSLGRTLLAYYRPSRRVRCGRYQVVPIILPTKGAERRVSAEAAQLREFRALKHGLMDDLLTGRIRVSTLKEIPA